MYDFLRRIPRLPVCLVLLYRTRDKNDIGIKNQNITQDNHFFFLSFFFNCKNKNIRDHLRDVEKQLIQEVGNSARLAVTYTIFRHQMTTYIYIYT